MSNMYDMIFNGDYVLENVDDYDFYVDLIVHKDHSNSYSLLIHQESECNHCNMHSNSFGG